MNSSQVDFDKVNTAKAVVLMKALDLVTEARDWIATTELRFAELYKAGDDEASKIAARNQIASFNADNQALQEVKQALADYIKQIREGNRPGGDTRIYQSVSKLEVLMVGRGKDKVDIEQLKQKELKRYRYTDDAYFTDADIIYATNFCTKHNMDHHRLSKPLKDNMSYAVVKARSGAYQAAKKAPISDATRNQFRLMYAGIEAAVVVALVMAILFPPSVAGFPLLAIAIPLFVITHLFMTLPVIGHELAGDDSYTRELAAPDFSLQDKQNLPVVAWNTINAVLNNKTSTGKASDSGLFKDRTGEDVTVISIQTAHVLPAGTSTEGLTVVNAVFP